ncbi:hypothetical protein [Companilactobacillus bobalius]|uniref:DUF4767 domain-containing protein n=2 Tax=Companilactobacillus bobalius TaxID=2801451 RepID=A0A202F9T8_9LACO|nr:hypothetical protein [Companilactobacillus bobalius]KAE9558848.1 hypothetical protein ATN92_13100 [Companilactobacillus bobalius]KRK84114.1 hypothetical protein FC78_GL001122 [Companilactobacillus bobalius DSM 19674]OVE97193.1 hypothetical protein LKACC16343_01683 [Companilactobacillus bobalius]GEO58762.1 hypothetical protein LBO01_18910 [Companilactobacillus paralimentarius]
MKKTWGLIATLLVTLTLIGCGNHKQSQASDSKVKTHKVVKANHKKKTVKKATKKTISSKTDNTSTAFSNQRFATSWIDSISGIFFKGNQYIWKYTNPVSTNADNQSSEEENFIVMQGTYEYDSNSKTITLNIANQSKAYTGYALELDKFSYQSVTGPSMPSTVRLQYVNDGNQNYLKPLTNNLNNMNMDSINKDGKDSNLTYENIISKFNVQRVESSMQKNADKINSAQDFEKFMMQYNFIQGKTNAFNGNGQVDEFKVYSNDDYQAALGSSDDVTPEKTVNAKYTVAPDAGMAMDMYFLGDDNNIYYGMSEMRPEVELAEEANAKYHQIYGN